jgi:hypothetical protein
VAVPTIVPLIKDGGGASAALEVAAVSIGVAEVMTVVASTFDNKTAISSNHEVKRNKARMGISSLQRNAYEAQFGDNNGAVAGRTII